MRGSSFKSIFPAIARYQNRPNSNTVLFSFALDEDLINPTQDLLERLARRIGLSCKVYQPNSIWTGDAPLPGLLRLEDGGYLAVLSETDEGGFRCVGRRNSGEQLDDHERDGQERNDRERVGQEEDGRDLAGDDEEVISRAEFKALPAQSFASFSKVYLNNSDPSENQASNTIEQRHWFFGSVARFWRSYIIVALAALFINLIALASPLFVMNVYDRVLPNEAMATLWVLAIGVSAALLFDFLLKTARAALLDYSGRKLDLRLSQLIYEKVLATRMDARPFSTGEYASRATQYEMVREFFSSNTLATCIDTLFVFIFLFVIWFIAGLLVIIPAVAFVVVVLVGFIAQARISRRIAAAANEAAQRQALLVESIMTAETVKCLRAEGALSKRWRELTVNSTYTSEQIKQISSTAATCTQFVQQLVTVGLILLGTFLFTEGRVTMGAIIASVILSGRAVAPLNQLTLTIARFRQVLLSLSILDRIMKLPDDEPRSIGFVNRQVTSGAVTFENVHFQYHEEADKALSGVNFKVRPGEKVGVIGRIGSGKTTLGRMMTALYAPQEGRVLIDGIDCQQYHPAEVRAGVALAGQSGDLFSGTIKENLLLAKPKATDAELLAATRRAGIDGFISRHPKGFDMQVGENGGALSAGQKQSVTIARLLLSGPKIVFLDEPSGAMDQLSEQYLIRSLRQTLGADTTVFLATHRYSMLELVDRLIVLDAGKVAADGPKKDVIDFLKRQGQAESR